MKIKLPVTIVRTAIGSAVEAASDDENRAHLNAVFLRIEPDRLTVAGTNGHWLALWQDKLPVGCDPGEAELLIPKADVRVLLANARKHKYGHVLIDTGARAWRLYSAEGTSVCNFGFAHLEPNAFPPFEQVVPGPGVLGNRGWTAIDPILLGQIARAFVIAHDGVQGSGTYLEPVTGEIDPVVMRSTAAPFLAVVMPMRHDPPPARVDLRADRAARTEAKRVREAEEKAAAVAGRVDGIASAVAALERVG